MRSAPTSKISTARKRVEFRALHQQGCFVLPNPWDVGSARMFQKLGFVAAATTSTGFAWTTGRADYAVTREEVMAHLTSMCAAVDIPINADFESGFASEPEGVARNVGLALQTGIAGLSIEDRQVDGKAGLYDSKLAIERVAAARASIDASGEDDVILVARTERLLSSPDATTQAIDSLVTFAEAGAVLLIRSGRSEEGGHCRDGSRGGSPTSERPGDEPGNDSRGTGCAGRAACQCGRVAGARRLGRDARGCRTDEGWVL